MTDYNEEQNTEIEALQSIYYDSFEVIAEDPHCFTLTVTGESEDEDEDLFVTVEFTYTPKYPDEAPIYEVKELGGLEEDKEKILSIIKQEVEENLGTVMIFTIVSAIQEFLNDLKEGQKKRAEEEKERRELEEEEKEKRKFHGTPVTVELFLAWKQKFEAEMLEIKLRENRDVDTRKKLTGKQLFLSDINLLEDELLDGETEAVAVDESLFEDLDDLDLDDLDDEDFDPNSYS